MYKLNGVELTESNGGLPSKHRIEWEPLQSKATIGSIVIIEGPSGRRRTITWDYDGRPIAAFTLLMAALDFEASPMSVIDCPDMERDALTGLPKQLANLSVVCVSKPPVQTPGNRANVDSFSLVFIEQYPQ